MANRLTGCNVVCLVIFALACYHASPVKLKGSRNHPKPRPGVKPRGPGPHPKPHPKNKTDCFEGLCWCDSEMADCSGHFGNLTFVPFINISTIEILNFSRNALTYVPADFFANLTHVNLTLIDLGHNGLSSFDPNAFRGLHTLHIIYVDSNNLTFETLGPVLTVPTLVRLDVLHNGIKNVPDDIFIRYPVHTLKTLNMHNNFMTVLNMTTLKPLKHMSNLGVNANHIKRVVPDRLGNLRYLNLENNRIAGDFIETCDKDNKPYYPELHGLYINNNDIERIDSQLCMSKVYVINLSYNKLRFFETNMFSSLKSLKILYLNQQHGVVQIEANAFSNPTLESLYMSRNLVDFSKPSINESAFARCPRLRTLMLDHSDFSKVPDTKVRKLFTQPEQLWKLYLGHCSISNITSQTFSGLKHLHYLYLYGNDLTEIPDGAFDEMPNLRILSIDENRIQTISRTTFNETTRDRLAYLDLSRNPYHCTCDIRWFRQWLMNSGKHLFVDYPLGYTCASYGGPGVSQASNDTSGQSELGDSGHTISEDGPMNGVREISHDTGSVAYEYEHVDWKSANSGTNGTPNDARSTSDDAENTTDDASSAHEDATNTLQDKRNNIPDAIDSINEAVHASDDTWQMTIDGAGDDEHANGDAARTHSDARGALVYAAERPSDLSDVLVSDAGISALGPKTAYANPTQLALAQEHAQPYKDKHYLVDFIITDQACMLSREASILTIAVTGLIVASLFFFLLFYKYRWHIRLAVYEVFRGDGRRRLREEAYEYDVYVSYAPEDLHWVVTELIPVMEQKFGLHLCINERDFPIGGIIADNILEAVYKSKRVLLILSPYSARCQWSQFELAVCQNYVMSNGDVLILALLESIPLRDVTGAMLSLLKTTSYIRWGEEEAAREAFWGRLLMAFEDVLPRGWPRLGA